MLEPNFVNSTKGNGSQYYNRLCVTFVSQHYTHNFRIFVHKHMFYFTRVWKISLR